MTTRRHLEDDQARALIQWRDCYVRQYPQLALLIAIPNSGGYKGGFQSNARMAARLKAIGVRAGVSDYFLPVPVGPFSSAVPPETFGLWLELKANGGKPTPAQTDWLLKMRGQGYAAEVATGWVAAAKVICTYLGIEGIAP